MSVIHMETEQVRAVAKNLEQSAHQVMDFSAQLVNQVENIPWEGQSREEFVIEISTLLRTLREKGEFVSLLASRVERHVSLWESCDSSFGGSSGGVANNPGDGSIATTAAFPEEGQIPPGYGPFPKIKPEPGDATTMAIGEEGQAPPGIDPLPGKWPEPGNPTTMVMGEEGQAPPGNDPMPGVEPEPPDYLTSLALGEEGQGTAPILTRVFGEEGSDPRIPPNPGVEPEPPTRSTMAMGEEGQDPGLGPIFNKPQPTTMAMGEEGQAPPGIDPFPWIKPEPGNPTTMALGEEGQAPPGIDPFPGIKPEPGNPTTMAIGEEGQAPGFRPFPPKGNEPPEIFTMAVGEEGLSPMDPPDLQKK